MYVILSLVFLKSKGEKKIIRAIKMQTGLLTSVHREIQVTANNTSKNFCPVNWKHSDINISSGWLLLL